jgi:hypothetical protein
MFVRMFQQDDTSVQYLFPANSRMSRSSDSSTTTAGHILLVTTRCCNYSLFVLLMMGEYFTRNM